MEPKKKLTIILCSCLIPSAVVGSVLGWFLGNYFKPGISVSGSITIDDTGYKNISNFINEVGDISTYDLTSKSDLNLSDVIAYAFYDFAYIENNCSYVGFSFANTPGLNTQKVSSRFIKKKSLYFKESVALSSTGFVKFGEAMANYDLNQEIMSLATPLNGAFSYIKEYKNITLENGSSKVKYDGKVKKYSEEKFIEKFSCMPTYPFNYVLSSDSINSESLTVSNYFGEEINFDNSIKLDGNSYDIYVNLNVNTIDSNRNYMITTTSGQNALAEMSALPEFYSIGMNIKLTRDLKLVEMSTIEYYKVFTKLANTDTYGYNKIVFSYDSNVSIPTLNNDGFTFSELEKSIIGE